MSTNNQNYLENIWKHSSRTFKLVFTVAIMLLDFKYEPLLGNRHIRLIKILPDGLLLPGVRIGIEQVSLHEKLAFHAISYTWDY